MMFASSGPLARLLRTGLAVLCLAVVWQWVAAVAMGQGLDPWPILDETRQTRGPGFFLSVWKIALAWLLFLVWVRTSDWVSRDCHERQLSCTAWNLATVVPFVLAMIVLWVVPTFWLGFPVLIAAHLVPLLAYVAKRNPLVMDNEKVLTPRHIKSLLAGGLRPFGVKVQVDEADPREEGPPITIIPGGLGSERDERANLMRARQSTGFPPVRRLIGEALIYRADVLSVDLLPQTTEVRFQVDGVWHPFEPEDVPTGAAMVDVMKLIAGLDLEEHATRQTGRCAVDYRNTQYACDVVTEMTKTGERAVLAFENPQKRFESLADLGMREKSQQALKEALAAKQGLVFFSALPKQGMTTTIDVALGSTDRLMREVFAIEEKSHREDDIENVTVVTYDATQKQTPAHVLPTLLRKYPDAIVWRDWSDGPSATQLCQLVPEGKLVVGSLAARDGMEALMRVLQLGVPPAALGKAIAITVNQRLLRRLCEACKESYEPTVGELKQFGIPEGRIKELFRPPVPDPTKKKRDQQPCAECSGIGYAGRTAVFEVIPFDDEMRQILATQPKLELLKAAARKAKVRTLVEEAVLLAAAGTTSLEEVTRAFAKA